MAAIKRYLETLEVLSEEATGRAWAMLQRQAMGGFFPRVAVFARPSTEETDGSLFVVAEQDAPMLSSDWIRLTEFQKSGALSRQRLAIWIGEAARRAPILSLGERHGTTRKREKDRTGSEATERQGQSRNSDRGG